jgi:BASS family bile acid:Na+ symporter
MLLPLGIALLVRARYPEPARQLQPLIAQASNVALLLVFVISLLANFQELIGVIGTGGILAVLVLIAGGVVFGALLGGSGEDTRTVLGLGTGQRNISAALLVATESFTDPQVLAMVLVGSTVGLIVLLPLAFELGRRVARTPTKVKEAKGEINGTPASTAAASTADAPPTGPVPAAG